MPGTVVLLQKLLSGNLGRKSLKPKVYLITLGLSYVCPRKEIRPVCAGSDARESRRSHQG